MVAAYALIEMKGSTPSGIEDYIIADEFVLINLVTFEKFSADSDWLLKNKDYICRPYDIPNMNNKFKRNLFDYFSFGRMAFNSFNIIFLDSKCTLKYALYYNGINLKNIKPYTSNFVIYYIDYPIIVLAYNIHTEELKFCYSIFNDNTYIDSYYDLDSGDFIGNSKSINSYQDRNIDGILNAFGNFCGDMIKIRNIYVIVNSINSDSLIIPNDCKILYIKSHLTVNNLVLPKDIIHIESLFLSDISFGTVLLSSSLKGTERFTLLFNKLAKIDSKLKIDWY